MENPGTTQSRGVPWWAWVLVSLVVIGIIIFLIWFLFFSGKGGRGAPDGSDCVVDTDCESGKCSRENNKCIRPDACNGPKDCAEGDICDNGRCIPGGCRDNLDCQINEICATAPESGTTRVCVAKPCTTTSDCVGESAVCISDSCVKRKCDTSAFCGANEACVGGVCVPKVPCIDGKCPSGMKCVDNMCVFCSSNSDCNAGEDCVSGICSFPCSLKGCTPDHVCTSPNINQGSQSCCSGQEFGQPCNSDQEGDRYCVGGTVSCTQGRIGDGCVSNRDCISGHCILTGLRGKVCSAGPECYFKDECENPDLPYCANGICTNIAEGSACIYRDDCGSSSLNCVNSRCVTTKGNYGDVCSSGDDCSSGLVCGPVSDKFPATICRLP